jgi:AP-4 complex subunit mu-1
LAGTQSVEGIHFLYIRRSGLYFVATTKFNVSPLETLELLTR